MNATLPRRNLIECKSGVSLVEFAFALPIVLLVAVGGLECANVALAHLRISQIATTTADTAARVLTQMDETDIDEVFSGIDMLGARINFNTNGRVVLSSLEPNGLSGSAAGQKITWQRCYGSLAVNPSYGREGAGATNGTLAAGLGPAGRKISAGSGTNVMFVEVTYQYQPLVYDVLNVGQIRYEAAFNVRERTSYNITNTTNRTLDVADVALPAATVVETVGTYVSQDGHAQRVRPAKAIRGINRTLVMEMGRSRQDGHGTPFDRWYNEQNQVDCKPGWESLPLVAQALGVSLAYKGPRQIMAEIAGQRPAFTGATYEAMGLTGVRLADVGETV